MFYKILWGYDDEKTIPIDSSELQKAFYCHLKGVPGLFKEGSISGNKIIAIQPDYHRIMGWNTGYKLNQLDYEDLDHHGVRKECAKELHEAKEAAQYKLETGKELPKKLPGSEIDTSGLVAKMKL